MRVLITGGFGYVGGRLARHLAAKGHAVLLGTRRLQPSVTWLDNVVPVTTPWDDAVQLAAICGGVDAIVHAAGMNAAACAADPVAALDFNGVATARLVEAAKRSDVRRFIHVSTAHVYAGPLAGEIDEDTCPRNLHPYATSHLAGEYAVLAGSAQGGLDGTVVRLSNAVGAPVTSDVDCWMLVFNDLCREAVRDGTLTLRSNAAQQRDFVTMADVCGAIEHLMLSSSVSLGQRIFNIGAGRSMSLMDLAELIQNRCRVVLGYTPPIQQLQPAQPLGTNELAFRIDRLQASGYLACNDFVAETDAMLTFCKQEFMPAA